MGLFEQFPYTNFHGVNLKWILDRLVEFETRLTTAEGQISSLEDRMDTAEDDIDALEGAVGDLTQLATTNKSSLVAAINENEGRLDTLETCCTAMQSQVPASAAGDAGKVLTATGAGAAVWRTPLEPVYLTYNADNPPDPEPYIEKAIAGHPVYLRYVTETNYTFQLPMQFCRNGNQKWLVFADYGGLFTREVLGQESADVTFWQIYLRKTSALGIQWDAMIMVG